MAGVSFALADFVTGGPILDLPVMKGASWSAQLNRPDELTCKVDMRDPDALALDLPSSSEPRKTVLLARTDDDVILAWGVIGDRTWDEDKRTLELSAAGVLSSYFGKTIIAPSSALTAALLTTDAEGYPIVNPALDTTFTGFSLGTIGKKLIAQRLAWPGAPIPFDLPADEIAPADESHTRTYLFASLKSIGSALQDLMGVENGPDFAFDAQRASDGISLRYVMRHGTEARPRIGTDIGAWSLGQVSPITGLKITDDGDTIASAAWLTAGRSSGAALLSRARNDSLVTASGYPPLDAVDTSHSDVSVPATLDAYARELIRYSAAMTRDVSFTVRADASPALGQYRPGDTVTLDVPEDHPYLSSSIPIRITSISGDESGKTVKVGCVVLDGS
ncbi:minor tail protein [Microbacterium phage OscarSo]|uniref:Minor tail protein n=1 Tax=Microbacterium phage OscarSo TaxID=2985324 RepID=A0A9X9K2U5_9CAUD|nr:minor tail protein [Microbacterium phage OscarSo]UYL87150.1 minor tail protein [Microbacterium phage OscarSo]